MHLPTGTAVGVLVGRISRLNVLDLLVPEPAWALRAILSGKPEARQMGRHPAEGLPKEEER